MGLLLKILCGRREGRGIIFIMWLCEHGGSKENMRGRRRGEGKTIIGILRGILLLGEGIIEALILS